MSVNYSKVTLSHNYINPSLSLSLSLSPSLSLSNSELSTVEQLERKASIPTPQLSRPVKSHVEPSYENTQIQDISTLGLPPRKITGESSGNYTEVPDSLPAFLRNENMLMLPECDEVIVKTAQKDFDESYARLSMIKIDDPANSQDDYMDPQDARDRICTIKTHEKLGKRVSKSKGEGGNSPSYKISMDNHEDYTMVSDALPDGSFEKVGNDEIRVRSRTTSDTSPMKKVTPKLKKKSESLKRPEHVGGALTQPLKRRSTCTKEIVTFDPKAGFKITAKRTSSDGIPVGTRSKESTNSAPSSPIQEDESESPPGKDVGGKHIYAAVDLTAKCRPENDIIRREGVGTPDHYVASVACM